MLEVITKSPDYLLELEYTEMIEGDVPRNVSE